MFCENNDGKFNLVKLNYKLVRVISDSNILYLDRSVVKSLNVNTIYIW